MRKKMFSIVSIISLVGMGAFLVAPNVAEANSFFWQGTDVSDPAISGNQGLIRYEDQKWIHDALLGVLPVVLYPPGTLPFPTVDYGGTIGDQFGTEIVNGDYVPSLLDGIPNPNGSIQNGLVRMPAGTLKGPRGLRIPCSSGKCWNGYTLVDTRLIDMDGTVVHRYNKATGSFTGAIKMLPGGDVIFSQGGDLVQQDWCGNELKRFPDLNNHHDHQRWPSTVGYYAPGPRQQPSPNGGRTLSLGDYSVGPDDIYEPGTDNIIGPDIKEDTTHIVNVKNIDPLRPHRPILDDVVREISWDGEVLFRWDARHHFVSASESDLGLGLFDDEAAHYALDLGLNSGGNGNNWSNVTRSFFGGWSVHTEDYTHANTVAWLGMNKWYTQFRDERFHPDNIIMDFRSLNNIIIIARHDDPEGRWEAGAVVWRMGPQYGTDGPDGKVGQIIGPHMAYMIPDGLPGAGNILVFDNGGGAGYGALIEGLTDPNTGKKLGFWMNKYRGFSRVLEIDPMTRQIVWQYVQAKPSRENNLGNNHLLYSSIMSGAQRLLNGNTLIQEADTGRVLEVTTEGEVVWEYAPTWFAFFGIYRSYRIPYTWVPQKLLMDKDGNGTYDVCETTE